MQYVIKKIVNDKTYSYYNKIFKDPNEAILELNRWMEFEASILQYQLEKNTIYTISIEDNTASIIKIVTSNDNIKIIKENMNPDNVNSLSPEEYLERKKTINKILENATQVTICSFQIECHEDNFVLPEVFKENYDVIAWKNETMIENNFLKTRKDFICNKDELEDGDYQKLFEFAIGVAESLKVKRKKAIIIKPDDKSHTRCFLYQGRKKLGTVMLFPSSVKELILK